MPKFFQETNTLIYQTIGWILLFFFYISNPVKVFAGEIELDPIKCPGGFCPDINNPSSPGNVLEQFFTTLLRFFTVLAGLMFLIYFLLGALTWLTSAGEKEKLQKAQGQMTNGLIGLVIIVAAYSVIYLVGKILGFDWLTPANEIKNIIPKSIG